MTGEREAETAIEQRLRSADERERALDLREAHADAWEWRRAERMDEVEGVLTEAAHRDGVAAARDSAASKRDMAANMQAWLSGDEGRAEAEARQEALDDRLHSAHDRASSAKDVGHLGELACSRSDGEDDPPPG